MQRKFPMAAMAAAVLSVAGVAAAQSVTYDFEDGTQQGWGAPFGGAKTLPVVSIGGSMRMQVPLGGFQVAAVDNTASAALLAPMAAAAAAPALYDISYDWYVDTSQFTGATFLQLGTYVNTGSGYYAQDFPGAGKEVELNGTQLASGQVFSGHVDVNMAAAGFAMPPADTFFRLGLIENGDGTGTAVYFDNISVHPVPEPVSLAMLGVLAPAMLIRRRRSA